VRSGALAQQWWRMLVRHDLLRDSRVLRHAHLTLRLLAMAAGFALAVTVVAQEPTQEPTQERTQPRTPQEQDQPVTYEEQVVVTASRAEQALVNAPAAVSVVTSETIQHSPATNIGDLLRTVPGLNVTQISARDINITARGATSTLATAQLALVDGRSVYLDFFGMVMWDIVPTNTSNIRQIEVIRGPASAVWGANAMNGVVNVITKSPREIAAESGNTLTIRAGAFERPDSDSDAGRGPLFSVDGSLARAIDDRWAYRVSAGYFTQDPLSRPTGAIANAFQTPYPSYLNTGTSQPKFDGRVDYEWSAAAW
jgi:outer membrane receptor protein involved in Fe transport